MKVKLLIIIVLYMAMLPGSVCALTVFSDSFDTYYLELSESDKWTLYRATGGFASNVISSGVMRAEPQKAVWYWIEADQASNDSGDYVGIDWSDGPVSLEWQVTDTVNYGVFAVSLTDDGEPANFGGIGITIEKVYWQQTRVLADNGSGWVELVNDPSLLGTHPYTFRLDVDDINYAYYTRAGLADPATLGAGDLAASGPHGLGGIGTVKVGIRTSCYTANGLSTYISYDNIKLNIEPEDCNAVKKYDAQLPGDFDGDCRVGLSDFAVFVEGWLNCNDPVYADCGPNWRDIPYE